MARRRNGHGGNGNFIAWLQTNLAELKKISAGHEERMRAIEERMDGFERFARSQQRDVLENRRQTRAIIAEIARMDAARRRDSANLAHTLTGINVRVRRLERRKDR